ncbi:MAG: diaminopimelate decarboxylase [Candidatus Bathyarchaeia archaeon]|nr:diaminopimelate decarboxylase [Candidatus Bathyarchaeota archaeon]
MIKTPMENVNGELYIDGVSTIKLVEEYGTPLYVISEKRIRENYRRLFDAFQKRYTKVRILYSAKANTNISVLKILKSEGAWIDAVSPGEIYISLEAGFLPSQILYTGTSVSEWEIEYALEKGVTINIDSLSQIKKMLKKKTPSTISVRINTEVGAGHHEYTITATKASKFGVDEKTALKIYDMAKKAGVRNFGIHMHIGSGIMEVTPFIKSTEKLLETAKKVQEELGIIFSFIDLGGGIGVPYKPEEKEVDIEDFASKLVEFFKGKVEDLSLGQPELWLEPGRYLVADACILLTKVNVIKRTPYRIFAGVDAGFNTLIRPAMYGSYHHMVVANKLKEEPAEKYDIVGPLCESGDILAKDRLLPILSEGDVLAILNAGAYGYSMSSQYNSRPRPAEILVMNGRYEIVRERETFQDLMRGQRVASWLKA